MNSRKLFTEMALKIELPEHADEINQLVFIAMEHLFGLTPHQVLTGTRINLTPEKKLEIDSIIHRLNHHEPIQHIVGTADFYGRSFLVNSSVLIPRPETEELVNLAIQLHPEKVLDIGTGSGCIAISLKLETKANVIATDVSDDALTMAKQNAKKLKAEVEFLKHNILKDEIPFTGLDLVISNPPYVSIKEKDTMKLNVLNYEPHLALFVENDDPLIFYKAIAEKSRTALSVGGLVAVEINENFGNAVVDVFASADYIDVYIHKDINGKDRIVTARYPGLWIH